MGVDNIFPIFHTFKYCQWENHKLYALNIWKCGYNVILTECWTLKDAFINVAFQEVFVDTEIIKEFLYI